MRLDVDSYMMRRAITILFGIPRPHRIRISSSGKGVHIIRDCYCENNACYDCWLYNQFDDKNRLKCNELRAEAGLSHNVLWDIKKGKECKDWQMIRNEYDIEMFLRMLYPYPC